MILSSVFLRPFFRQGYGEGEVPLRRAHCAPPTVAGGKKLHAHHWSRQSKKDIGCSRRLARVGEGSEIEITTSNSEIIGQLSQCLSR